MQTRDVWQCFEGFISWTLLFAVVRLYTYCNARIAIYSSLKFSMSGANNTVHLSENSRLQSCGFLSQADRYLHADLSDIRFKLSII